MVPELNKSSSLKDKFIELLASAEPVTERSEKKPDEHSDPAHSSNPRNSEGGVDLILRLVENDPLFIAEDDGSSLIYRGGRLLPLDAKHRELSEDFRLDFFEHSGKAPSKETVATAIDLLSAKARRIGETVKRFTRIGEKDGNYYYDMADGRAVETVAGSWSLKDAPIMFRQMRHQKKQVEPDPLSGDPWIFLEFFNLKEEQRLLFITTLITCFIPCISHPALHISGSQGAGKSLLAKFVKSLIDPSSVLLSMMPRKPEDLDLLFWRYKVIVLDNLSSLSFDVCDRLCSLISGGVIEKRTLHTDLDMTVLKSNPIILYTSIANVHSRPDLAERTIVLQLGRIPDEKRMTEPELFERFEAAVPVILGGIFDVLSRAMCLYPHCQLSSVPRMAEFAKWGYVIAEELGGKGDQFLEEYAGNSSIQTGELIERDTLFGAIVEAMNQPGRETLSGSFNEVLLFLMEVAAPGEAKNGYTSLQKDKTFPGPRGLRKHIERIRIPLENMGISFKIDSMRTSQAKAFLTISKMEVTETQDYIEGLF